MNLKRLGAEIQGDPRLRSLSMQDPSRSHASVEVGYRCGTYESFLRDLLARVRSEVIGSGDHAGSRPLAALDLEARNEWAVGLLKAWAEVADILTFYQERIANEGYLGSAREESSIREIVRLLDYVPFPGTAAATHLAYKLLDVAGTPETVQVPERASVTSIPERKETPQTWETVEGLDARREWNALRPALVTTELRPPIAPGTRVLQLAGLNLGLEAADFLLLELTDDNGSAWHGRRVVACEEVPATAIAPAFTKVELDEALVEAESVSARVPDLVSVVTFEREHRPFGFDAPPWESLDDPTKAEYAPIQGGVVSRDSQGRWHPLNSGLPPGGVVSSLLVSADGTLLAGTDNGIFRTTDRERWSRSGDDLVGQQILTLAADGHSQLFAGTAKNGVLRSADGSSWDTLLGESIREPLLTVGRGALPRSGRLPGAPIRAVLPTAEAVFAGTDHGVFAFVPSRDTWTAVNTGLPDLAPKTGRAGAVVFALAAGRRPQEIFAGTDQGLFVTGNSGRRWAAANAGLPGHDAEEGTAKIAVLAIHAAFDSARRASILLIGTDQGVFRSLDAGRSWEPASLGLPGTDLETGASETPVSAIVRTTDPQTHLTTYFAATAGGLFVSTDAGIYWSPAGSEVAEHPVSAIAIDGGQSLVAAVPLGGFDRQEWPGYHLAPARIDLAQPAEGIHVGEHLAIVGGADEAARVEMARVASSEPAYRQDFNLAATVTRVTTAEPIPQASEFDLRRARVLTGNRTLAVASGARTVLEPVGPGVVPLDRAQPLHPFDGPRPVFVTGKPLRVELSAARLIDAEGEQLVVEEGAEPQVIEVTERDSRSLTLRLRLRDGSEGVTTLATADVRWQPAREDDAATAELVHAEWLESIGSGGGPGLDLQPMLRGCFDPTTVQILANVVEATQGKTVYMDVLGSGDATVTHQQFEVAAPPLTYVTTASTRGWASTLEIRVQSILWREVESLHGAGPGDRVYMIRHGAPGVATVIFGDGRHGARLPSGRENVVALYRSGMWLTPVGKGRLAVPETKPLGVDGVQNPAATQGGAPPETPDLTRARAPIALRTLGRIVSLQDYEDFCQAYPGVVRARVAPIRTDSGTTAQITIATASGVAFAKGDDFHRRLVSAIERARGDRRPFSVDTCRWVTFDLEAVVRFDLDYRAGDVERAVRQRLATAYGRESSVFEGRINASAVVGMIGRVPGVRSVGLRALHRSARPVELHAFVKSVPARWNRAARGFLGAELLELRQPAGLALTMEPAS